MNQSYLVRRMPQCWNCRIPGFSLVEMLVSIGILVILASLLVPSLQRGRQMANQARCSGNLRGLIQGWSLYTADHGGNSVTIGVNEDPSNKYTGWVSQLWPYLGNGNIDRLIVCPSAKQPNASNSHGTSQYAWKLGNMVGSYGFNSRWYIYADGSWPGGVDNYYKKQINGTPKEGPVIADAAWVDFDRGGGPPTDYDTSAGSGAYAIVRHGGKGVNMAFSDGSVRLVSMGEVFSNLKLRPNDVISPTWINSVPDKYR